MHLFISPHLDDIALSCGGYVRQLRARGEEVVVATVCTADTPTGVVLSEPARHVHWEWQLGEDNPYGKRRAEDLVACAVLGANAQHLGFPDAVYRYDAHAQPLYTRDFIGGRVRAEDWRVLYFAMIDALRRIGAGAAQRYCPLAIGGHVDHVLVRSAAETAFPDGLTYYEDYPYAQKVGEGNPNVARELAMITHGLHTETIVLAEADIVARIDWIAAYRSQQFALFEVAESMPAKVRAYIAASGGERYYR
jgi:LmbE family N-acetylglucosaminyl deacetylase